MPAKSKNQQKFMGMVYALKKKKISPTAVSEQVKKVASKIKTKEAREFAATKTKHLPNKKQKSE